MWLGGKDDSACLEHHRPPLPHLPPGDTGAVEAGEGLRFGGGRGHARRPVSAEGYQAALTRQRAAVCPASKRPNVSGSGASAQASEPVAVEEVVVTGSRVRTTYNSPTPVNVVGAERMQQLAIPDVATALNQIPSFRATVSASTILFRVSGAIGGASEMLVQGERHGGSGQLIAAGHTLRLLIVISVIPFS